MDIPTVKIEENQDKKGTTQRLGELVSGLQWQYHFATEYRREAGHYCPECGNSILQGHSDECYLGHVVSRVMIVSEEEQVLLDALKELSVLGNGDRPGNSHGNIIAQRALAKYRELTGLEVTP